MSWGAAEGLGLRCCADPQAGPVLPPRPEMTPPLNDPSQRERNLSPHALRAISPIRCNPPPRTDSPSSAPPEPPPQAAPPEPPPGPHTNPALHLLPRPRPFFRFPARASKHRPCPAASLRLGSDPRQSAEFPSFIGCC